jgi:hypothetical protein
MVKKINDKDPNPPIHSPFPPTSHAIGYKWIYITNSFFSHGIRDLQFPGRYTGHFELFNPITKTISLFQFTFNMAGAFLGISATVFSIPASTYAWMAGRQARNHNFQFSQHLKATFAHLGSAAANITFGMVLPEWGSNIAAWMKTNERIKSPEEIQIEHAEAKAIEAENIAAREAREKEKALQKIRRVEEELRVEKESKEQSIREADQLRQEVLRLNNTNRDNNQQNRDPNENENLNENQENNTIDDANQKKTTEKRNVFQSYVADPIYNFGAGIWNQFGKLLIPFNYEEDDIDTPGNNQN